MPRKNPPGFNPDQPRKPTGLPRLFVGIDPGVGGSTVVLDEMACPVFQIRHKWTLLEQGQQFKRIRGEGVPVLAVIEKVSSSPQQGVVSAFTFGKSRGHCEAFLVANGIPWEEVAPGTWQRAMRCLSKGDKNVTKFAAQKLWPDAGIVHANADAFLLAEYCRRLCVERRLI